MQTHKPSGILVVFALLALNLGSGGCFGRMFKDFGTDIVMDGAAVHYEVAPDLSGTGSYRFVRMHSLREGRAPGHSRTYSREWCDFAETLNVYEDMTLEAARHLGLGESQSYRLEVHEDDSCDAVARGEFEDLARALAWASEQGGRFERSAGRLSVALPLRAEREVPEPPRGVEPEGQSRSFVLSIAYAGPILEHNAHRFDPQTGRMEWDLTELGEDVRFVLELAPGGS